MATRKLLTNGNAFKRTDGRWGGTVWYMDEAGNAYVVNVVIGGISIIPRRKSVHK